MLAALGMGLNYLGTASQYGHGEGERGYANLSAVAANMINFDQMKEDMPLAGSNA